MIRKILAILLLIVLGMATIGYFRYYAGATYFSGNEKIIYIYTSDANKTTILNTFSKDSIVKNPQHFDWFANKLNYWENIKPGRYKITTGMSINEITRLLRSGQQFPAKLVINKLRLKEDLVKVLDKALEADSFKIMEYIGNLDSLKQQKLNDTNLLAHILPDTYEVIWTWTPQRTLKKLLADRDAWWGKNNREDKARAIGLRPEEVHTLASIVEEETNLNEDKPKVASVYLNRLQKGMPLQADPTVRYALKNFKMNRVLFVHLRTPSPYNTYLNKGLPPGPICTPSPVTIDAVLNAPQTDYIFFVANADLRGGSTFTTNLADHNRAANVYQDSLTAWLKRKAIREKAKSDSIAKAQQSTGK